MMALLETAPPAERPPAGAAALHALAAAAAFGIFGFYLATAYPTLSSYRDSGDMAASALTLGVAHPPGYPFFTLISRAWLAVFRLGNVAYRLHVFSAACGAGACLTIFLAFLRAGRRSQTGSHIGAGLCAAFLLAFAPAFRHLSVVSEMYSLNALLTALLFALIFRAGDDASPRELCAAALLLGLGMGNHQTILAAAPLILIAGWKRLPLFKSQGGPCFGRPGIWPLAGFFLLGLLVYAYLPLRSLCDPVLNWGEPHSMRGFFRMLTRADYGGVRLVPERPAGLGSLSGWTGGLLLSVRIFSTELGFSGVILLALGCLRARHSRAAAGALSAFLLSGPVFIIWANLDPSLPETFAILEPHLVLPIVFAAILAGLGAQSLSARLANSASGAVSHARLALASAALAAGWIAPRSSAPSSHRADFSAWDFGAGLLDSLPKGSVLLDPDDPTAFTLNYMLQAHGRRPDVVPFLYFRTRWGYEQFRRRHPELLPQREIRSGQELLAVVVSKGLAEGRPLFIDLPQKSPAGTAAFPSGLAYRLFKTPTVEPEGRRLLDESLGKVSLIRHRQAPARMDFFTRHTLAYWPSALNNLGVEAQGYGLQAEAVRIYQLALRAGPWLAESWNNWGNAEIAMRDPGAAVGCYLASVREKPSPQVVYNLGRAYLLMGNFDLAEGQFKTAINAANLLDAHNDLGLVYLRTGKTEDALRQWLGVLERNPSYPAAYYNLAIAFERMGKRREALQALSEYRNFVRNPIDRQEIDLWMRKLKK